MADDHGYSAIKPPQGLVDAIRELADKQEKDRAEGKPPREERNPTKIRNPK